MRRRSVSGGLIGTIGPQHSVIPHDPNGKSFPVSNIAPIDEWIRTMNDPSLSGETLAETIQRIGPPPPDIVKAWCERLAGLNVDHPIFVLPPATSETLRSLRIDDGGLLLFGNEKRTSDPDEIPSSPAEWTKQFHDQWLRKTEVSESAIERPSSPAFDTVALEPSAFETAFHVRSVEVRDGAVPRQARSILSSIPKSILGGLVAASVFAAAAWAFLPPPDVDKWRSSGTDVLTPAPTNSEPAAFAPVDVETKQDDSVALETFDTPSDRFTVAPEFGFLSTVPGQDLIADVLGAAPRELFSSASVEDPDTEQPMNLPASMADDESWNEDDAAPATAVTANENDGDDTDEKRVAETLTIDPIAVTLDAKDQRHEFDSPSGGLDRSTVVTATIRVNDSLDAVWIDPLEGESAKRARGMLLVHESGADPAAMDVPVIAIAVDARSGRSTKVRLRTAVRPGANSAWQNVDQATLNNYAIQIANRGVEMDQLIARLSAATGIASSRQRALLRMQSKQIKTAAGQLSATSERVAKLVSLVEQFVADNELRFDFGRPDDAN